MRCEPANTIINKFSGIKPVADITEVTVHSVMRWRRSKSDGGTGGIIPHWHMAKLLDAARCLHIDLAPEEFLQVQRPDIFGPAPVQEQVA